MANTERVSKIKIDEVLKDNKVYTNIIDAKNKTNARNPLPEWWGDNNRELELDLDTGIVWETQEDGSKVGMGALDEDGIKAIMKVNETKSAINYKTDSRFSEVEKKKTVSAINYNTDTRFQLEQKDQLSSDSRFHVGYNLNEGTKENGGVLNTLKRTGATVAAFGGSVIEGIGKFGEALVDTGTVVSTILSTPTALTFDLLSAGKKVVDGQGLNKVISDFADESITTNMWKISKAFVAKKHVSSWADSFWDNTKVGKSIKENAYGFDTARTAGNSTGEIIGIVALTALTFGIGGLLAGAGGGVGVAAGSTAVGTEVAVVGATETGVALAGSTAAGVGAAVGAEAAVVGAAETGVALAGGAVGSAAVGGTVAGGAATTAAGTLSTATLLSIFSGIEGFGKHVEDSWANGESIPKGLAAGTAGGAVNFALSQVGAKVIMSPSVSRIAKAGINSGVGMLGSVLNTSVNAYGNNNSFKEEFEKAGGIKGVISTGIISGIGTYIAAGKTTYEQLPGDENPAGYIEDKNPSAGRIEMKDTTSGTTSSTGRGSASTNPAGYIEDKNLSAGRIEMKDTTSGTTSSTGRGSASTNPAGYIEEGSTPIQRIQNNGNHSSTNSSTTANSSSSASSSSNSSGTSGSGNSGTTNTSSSTNSSATESGTSTSTAAPNMPGVDLDTTFVDNMGKLINRRGGMANLSQEQVNKLASGLNISESELMNMNRSTYVRLMKQYHPDNENVNSELSKAVSSLLNTIYNKTIKG